MPLPGQIVLAVGIDDRHALRQCAADLMMIQNNHVGAGLPRRRDGGRAVGAAVDGDDQLRAARDKFAHGFGIGTVTLENTIRNVDFGAKSEMREKTLQKRRGSRPIDIVVAKDRYFLALHDGIGNARSGGIHIGQRRGIRQKIANGRIEEALCFFGIDAAAGEHAGDKIGDAVALGDREGGDLLPFGQPVFPRKTGCRLPYV